MAVVVTEGHPMGFLLSDGTKGNEKYHPIVFLWFYENEGTEGFSIEFLGSLRHLGCLKSLRTV